MTTEVLRDTTPEPVSSAPRFGLRRTSAYVAAIVGTLAAVYFATRGSSGATADTAAQAHGASAAAPARQPVVLSPDAARRIGITFATASVGALESEVRTVGQIAFDESRVRTISLRVDGWVERLFVNSTGQAVSMGQPLFTIYSPMLVAAQEELLLARRLEADVASGSAESRRGASDLVASARRRLESLDIRAGDIAEVERTGSAMRTMVLRSTASGSVLEKKVVAGQKVMAGDALYSVADLSTVWVEGDVFEQDLAKVRVGQTVHADFQALPGEHRMGRIAFVYPTLDPETRTAKVRVTLENPALRLKPGMYATLRIASDARSDALLVPRGAVLSTGERSIVFVRDATGHLVPREVTIGGTSGETVVASATFLVDAESNLGSALGGMGSMPGMEMTQSPVPLPMPAAPRAGH